MRLKNMFLVFDILAVIGYFVMLNIEDHSYPILVKILRVAFVLALIHLIYSNYLNSKKAN